VSGEARGAANEKLNACVEKGGKGNMSFSDPAYIRSINIGRPVPSGLRPYILVGFRLKLMNIILNIFVGTDKFKNLDK
jgi:hypothetical protein